MSWRLKRAPQFSCTKKKRSRENEIKSEPPFKCSSVPEIVPYPALDTVNGNQDSIQETPELPTPDQIDPSPAIWEPDSPTFDLSRNAHATPLHPGFANNQKCGDTCCASRQCRIAPYQVWIAPAGVPTLLQVTNVILLLVTDRLQSPPIRVHTMRLNRYGNSSTRSDIIKNVSGRKEWIATMQS